MIDWLIDWMDGWMNEWLIDWEGVIEWVNGRKDKWISKCVIKNRIEVVKGMTYYTLNDSKIISRIFLKNENGVKIKMHIKEKNYGVISK